MANFAFDFSTTSGAYLFEPSLYATAAGVTNTSQATGTGVDCVSVGSGAISVALIVGTVAGTTPTLDAKVQESSDNSSWSDITGATFTQVTASDTQEIILVKPTKRYLRTAGTVAGTNPVFEATTFILAPLRNAPANDGGFDLTSAPGN